MRHGVFSDAVTRFTKGIPAELSTPVLNEAVRMITQFTGATVASDVVDAYPKKESPITIRVTEAFINNTLGTQFASNDIYELLRNVGFGVEFSNLEATVTVPYWRQDIHIAEDIVEEVGRLAGYDTIHLSMPTRDFVAVTPHSFDELRSTLRKSLVRTGANEVLTYSFVHGDVFKKSGQTTDNAYRIVNSISPDLQYYRQSLTPSLLSQVFANVKAGYGSFSIFELNKVHQKSHGLNEEGVPVEHDSLALVLTDAKKQGAAYYDAKRILEYTLGVLGVEVSYMPLTDTPSATRVLFEPKRSALVVDAKSGTELGVVGEYKKSVQKSFKLPEYTAGFELSPHAVHESAAVVGVTYKPLSRYPGTERDICFQVRTETSYGAVVRTARAALDDVALITSIEPLDIYQAEGGDVKNVTIRIALASYDKTLTGEEVAEVISRVTNEVISVTDGRVI